MCSVSIAICAPSSFLSNHVSCLHCSLPPASDRQMDCSPRCLAAAVCAIRKCDSCRHTDASRDHDIFPVDNRTNRPSGRYGISSLPGNAKEQAVALTGDPACTRITELPTRR